MIKYKTKFFHKKYKIMDCFLTSLSAFFYYCCLNGLIMYFILENSSNFLKGNLGNFIIIVILILPFVMAIRTYKILDKGYTQGYSRIERAKAERTERFYHAWIFSMFAMMLLMQSNFIDNIPYFRDSSSQTILFLGFPILISNLLVYSIPILYKIISSFTQNPNWFKEKVLVPILTSLLIGVLTWIFTGQFKFGSSITLMSIPIAWILKLTINIEAES